MKYVKYDNPEEYDKRYSQSLLDSYGHDLWYPFLVKKIREFSANKIALDLGCGTCEYTKHMKSAKLGIGMDISGIMLKYGYEKLKNASVKENILLLQANAYNIPLKSNSVDLIVCIGLLEYVNLEKVFIECRRVLKSRGNLLILVPNKWNFYNFVIHYKNIIKKRWYFREERSFAELRAVSAKLNFKLIEKNSFGMITYCPIALQKICRYLWKALEKIWQPFQKYLPLGNNLYLVFEKL